MVFKVELQVVHEYCVFLRRRRPESKRLDVIGKAISGLIRLLGLRLRCPLGLLQLNELLLLRKRLKRRWRHRWLGLGLVKMRR